MADAGGTNDATEPAKQTSDTLGGSSPSDPSLERMRIRYGFYKVLAGSTLVGALGVLVPGAIEFWQVFFDNKRQELELRITQAQQQREYVKEFLDTALIQDIEHRLRFAQYFSKVSTTDFKDGWNELYTDLQGIRNTIRSEIHVREGELRRLLAVEEKSRSVEQQVEIAQLKRELEWRYREVGYVERGRSVVPSRQEEASDTGGSGNERVPISFLIGGGYDPSFLGGLSIPVPKLADSADGSVSRLKLLLRPHHSILYSLEQRAALAVAVNVDGAKLFLVRRGTGFIADPTLAPSEQIGEAYYRGNDYDRGQLLSRRFFSWGETEREARIGNDSAFLYSQVDLMHRNLNRDEWAQLEQHVLRQIIGEKRAIVFAGPVFQQPPQAVVAPQGLEPRPVPSAFWMITIVIDAEGRQRSIHSFIVPQNADTIAGPIDGLQPDKFRTPVKQIEAATGLTFLGIR